MGTYKQSRQLVEFDFTELTFRLAYRTPNLLPTNYMNDYNIFNCSRCGKSKLNVYLSSDNVEWGVCKSCGESGYAFDFLNKVRGFSNNEFLNWVVKVLRLDTSRMYMLNPNTENILNQYRAYKTSVKKWRNINHNETLTNIFRIFRINVPADLTYINDSIFYANARDIVRVFDTSIQKAFFQFHKAKIKKPRQNVPNFYVGMLPVYEIPRSVCGGVFLGLNRDDRTLATGFVRKNTLNREAKRNAGFILPPHYESNIKNKLIMINDPILATKLNVAAWRMFKNYTILPPFLGYFTKYEELNIKSPTSYWSWLKNKAKYFWYFGDNDDVIKMAIHRNGYIFSHKDHFPDFIPKSSKWGDNALIRCADSMRVDDLYSFIIQKSMHWTEWLTNRMLEIPQYSWKHYLNSLNIVPGTVPYAYLKQRLPNLMTSMYKARNDPIDLGYVSPYNSIPDLKYDLRQVTKFDDKHIYGFIHLTCSGIKGQALCKFGYNGMNLMVRYIKYDKVDNDYLFNNKYVISLITKVINKKTIYFYQKIKTFDKYIGYNIVDKSFVLPDMTIKEGQVRQHDLLPVPYNAGFKQLRYEKYGKFNIKKAEKILKLESAGCYLSLITVFACLCMHKMLKTTIAKEKRPNVRLLCSKNKDILYKFVDLLGIPDTKYSFVDVVLKRQLIVLDNRVFATNIGTKNDIFVTVDIERVDIQHEREFNDAVYYLFVEALRFLTSYSKKDISFYELNKVVYNYLVYTLHTTSREVKSTINNKPFNGDVELQRVKVIANKYPGIIVTRLNINGEEHVVFHKKHILRALANNEYVKKIGIDDEKYCLAVPSSIWDKL